jgi:hypothetical protein
MARVALDAVPTLGRPEAVAAVVAEAAELRDRLRQANEELAAAQAEYEAQQQADVEHAAERARKGAALGTVPQTVEKARSGVELAKRNPAAIGLASQAAQDDVAEALLAHAHEWRSSLADELEHAREDGRKALERLQAALTRISDASAVTDWLNVGANGGGFDRPIGGAWTALTAPTSARRMANGSALNAGDVLGFAGELVDGPPAPKPAILRTQAAADAAA